METLFLYIVFLALLFLGYRCYKDYIKKEIRDRASWWLTEDGATMLDYIQNKCVKDMIENTYLVTSEEECKIAYEIISVFQEESKEKFLKGYYSVDYKYFKMNYSEYFMFFLEKFLNEHNDYCFNDNRMYIEVSRENCDYSYYSKCTITDYGMVYNKIQYMAVMFCEKSTRLKGDKDFYSSGVHSGGIKKELDTKETTFWHRHHW